MCATRQTSAAGADAWRGEEHVPMGENRPCNRQGDGLALATDGLRNGRLALRPPGSLRPLALMSRKPPIQLTDLHAYPGTFVTVGQLSDYWRISRKHVLRLIESGILNPYGWDRKRSGCRSIPQWLSSAAIRKVESCRPSREPERTLRCDPDSLTRSPAFECGDLVAGETRHARACDRGAARAVA